MKLKRKLRRIFSLYNIAVFAILVIIIVSVIIILKPEKKVSEADITKDNVVIEDTQKTLTQENTSNDEKTTSMSEITARALALKKFNELGETNISTEALNVVEITRNNEISYFISSPENTIEITKNENKITRINSILVD